MPVTRVRDKLTGIWVEKQEVIPKTKRTSWRIETLALGGEGNRCCKCRGPAQLGFIPWEYTYGDFRHGDPSYRHSETDLSKCDNIQEVWDADKNPMVKVKACGGHIDYTYYCWPCWKKENGRPPKPQNVPPVTSQRTA